MQKSEDVFQQKLEGIKVRLQKASSQNSTIQDIQWRIKYQEDVSLLLKALMEKPKRKSKE